MAPEKLPKAVVALKPVISALIESDKTWSELKELKVNGRIIPDKSLARSLKYLEYLDLAKKNKEGGFWTWYERSRVFSSTDVLNHYLKHSEQLIPALKGIVDVASEDKNPEERYAEEHLRSYPEIYRNLSEFRELQKTQAGKVLERIRGKFRGPDKMWMMHLEKNKAESLWGRILGGDVLVKDDVPYYMGPFSLEELKELQGLVVAKPLIRNGNDWYIQGPLKIAMLDRMVKLYHEIAGDISLLILKINHGTPLEGVCSLCKEVKITNA